MNTTQWRQVKKLFDQTIDLPKSEQSSFLKKNCNDSEIINEVLGLIAAEESNQTVSVKGLNTIVISGAHKLIFQEQGLNPGDQVGAYRIQKLIGQGGMGSVYLANRTDEQFEQNVAIKITHQTIKDSELSVRFAFERQVLGQLEHPYIARIYDAGRTIDEHPYIIMEYVDGENIIDYCNRNQLSLNARITLFNQVCEAVHYSHQKGIIHRDLKPGNILISEIDDKPTPKVIDFGIAQNDFQRNTSDNIQASFSRDNSNNKINHESSVEINTSSKSNEGRLGTPSYMSPEQLASPEAVDIRSDVYAMGVLLYHLISGCMPFKIKSQDLEEVLKIKLSYATPPSIQLLNNKNNQMLAEQRQLNVKSLSKALKIDLDAICVKAIHPEVNSRYSTISALADDLSCYQQNLPVSAVSNQHFYRLTKQFKRNRFQFIAASVFIIGLFAEIITTSYALVQETKAHELAQQESDKASAINQYLQEMFLTADPRKKGKQTKIVDVLSHAEDNIEDSFKNLPVIKASLYSTFGKLRTGLNDYDIAMTLLLKAKALQEQFLGKNHVDTLTTTNLIGEVYASQNELPTALGIFEENLIQTRRYLGNTHRLTMTTINNVAVNNYLQNEDEKNEVAMQKALSMMEELLALRTQVLGEEHAETSHARNNLAYMYGNFNQPQKALKLFKKNLEIQIRVFGEKNYFTLSTRNNIGIQYQDLDQLDEAETYMQASYVGLKEIQGVEHINTLRSAVSYISLLVIKNKIEPAKIIIQEIEKSLEKHPQVWNWFDEKTYQLAKNHLELKE